MLLSGLSVIFNNPLSLIWVFIGVIVGIIFGAIPGLSATMAIAIFLPITYSLTTTEGMGTMMGLYIGDISGGLISAILLNIRESDLWPFAFHHHKRLEASVINQNIRPIIFFHKALPEFNPDYDWLWVLGFGGVIATLKPVAHDGGVDFGE